MAIDEEGIEVEGTEAAVAWQDYDPGDWRNHPEPPSSDNENDEDQEWPTDMASVLGFDPSTIDWDEEEESGVKSTKGGPGSGNFGHEGRPGEVGRSAGDDSLASSAREGKSITGNDDLRAT